MADRNTIKHKKGNKSHLFHRHSLLTVTVKEQVAVFPLTSVAVYVTRVTPTGKLEPG